MTTGFGSLVVKNPASVNGGPGVRDDWLRMKWKREYITLYLGDPTWAKSDFRVILKGRLKQPTAPATNKISFPIADLAEKFDFPISSDLFSSGPYANQRVPIYLGQVAGPSFIFKKFGGQIEPPLTDENNLIYTIADDEIDYWFRSGNDYLICRNNQVEIIGSAFIDSVAGNVITSDVSHGFSLNWLIRLVGTPPAPLAVDTDYWVQSVPAANQLTLSATRGGAVITLTDTAAGARMDGFGYTVTSSPAPATVQLANNPGINARITVGKVAHTNTDTTCGGAYINVVKRMGFTDDDIDADTSIAAFDIGLWVDTNLHTAAEVLEKISAGSLSWYGFTCGGLFQNGQLTLPTDVPGDPVLELKAQAIKQGSLRLITSKPPIDFSKVQVTQNQWFLAAGPFHTGSQTALQGYTVAPPFNYGPSSTPLDDYPTFFDSGGPFKFDSIITNADAASFYYPMFLKTIGVFTFQTTIMGLHPDLSIGSLITLTHPRLGWKQYTAGDPQSPDNSADFDATKAVVIGQDVNLSSDDPFPVKLTVFRQIPGYYPEDDLT